MSLISDLEYRTLAAVLPSEPSTVNGSFYTNKSKLRFLFGAELGLCRDRIVLDYGCGEGREVLELLEAGAQFAIGLDVNEKFLDQARARATAAGLQACTFTKEWHEPVDVILSLDSFEHYAEPEKEMLRMRELLRPGGRLLASFGPSWYHPLGGHFLSVFPWAHIVLSESALLRWRGLFREDGARTFADAGLNRMTIARFERLVRQAGLVLESLETIPIRRLRWVHNRLTREFTTAIVKAKLIRI